LGTPLHVRPSTMGKEHHLFEGLGDAYYLLFGDYDSGSTKGNSTNGFYIEPHSFLRVSCRGGTKVREKDNARKPDLIDIIPASQSNAFVEYELSA